MDKTLAYETEWLREYASTYLPNHATVEFDPEQLAEAGIDLPDLKCLFLDSRVVYSDKVDAQYSHWIVIGNDCDDNPMRATLLVHTQEMRIKVKTAMRLGKPEGTGNDAA